MATILSISRDAGYADRLRDYRILCDGREIGRIRNAEARDFEIAPGEHRLLVKIDWCRSNEVQFSVHDGDTARFLCGNNLRGLRLLLAIFYVLFARKHYLLLRRIGV